MRMMKTGALAKMALLIGTVLLLLSACKKGDDNYLGSGSFEANEVLVSSEVNGRIIEWNLEEGHSISAGTVVGVVDTTQLQLQKEALQHSVQAVRVSTPNVAEQTEAIRVQLRDLRRQRQRVKQLLEVGAASQKSLEDIETGIASLESQLVAARGQLTQSGSQLDAQSSAYTTQIVQIEDMIRRSHIQSPTDGVVVANYVHAGEVTGAGRPLFRVADLENLYLRAYIPANRLSNIQVGDRVRVRIDSQEDEPISYAGVVTWISSEAEFTPSHVQTEDERANQVFAVKIRVPNDGSLRIGMYGEAFLRGAEK